MQLPIAAGRTWTGGRRGPYLNDNSVMLAQRIPIAGARSGTVYRGAKNIPRKGPQNCRSLHGTPGQVGFARDDEEKGRGLRQQKPTEVTVLPERSRPVPACRGGICSSVGLSWECFFDEATYSTRRSTFSTCALNSATSCRSAATSAARPPVSPAALALGTSSITSPDNRCA